MALSSVEIASNVTPRVSIDSTIGSVAPPFSSGATLASGTSDGQVDKHYIASGSVASGSPVTLDFNGGGLVGLDGSAFNIVDLVYIKLKNTSPAGGGTITYGAAANPIANLAGTLPPGAEVVLFDATGSGWPVVAGSADGLKLASSSGTATYAISAGGRST